MMHLGLVRMATTGPRHGLGNRRGFVGQASQLRAGTVSDGQLSAILLDIDNFKQINDAYGHDAGDEAIRACADAARLDEAVTGRLGGDEFALLLERRSLSEAIEIAEELRHRLAARPVDTGRGRITLTWSIGVGEAQPDDSIDQLLARADAALYSAKESGRNQVASARPNLRTKDTVAQHGIARAAAC